MQYNMLVYIVSLANSFCFLFSFIVIWKCISFEQQISQMNLIPRNFEIWIYICFEQEVE